jgi:hypothetical protein
MTTKKFLGCLMVTSLLVTLGACGSDGDDGDGGDARSCEELCSEGQAGSCTTVQGDCGAFCDALDRATPKAGCPDAPDDYEACLSETADVCSSDCASEESALESCLIDYCVANPSDPDCPLLAASF